ncbi:MAG: Slp family lipoprotein [Kangiellaceae bacterium]|nr:Slp family lipoprotein [Kangiellaceae bacterium]
MTQALKLSLIVAATALLSACMSAPRSVQTDVPTVSFIQVAQSPNAHVGQEVQWGGIIARVENLERDTMVEIVNLPLDYQARPVANQQTGGRFIARVPGFLDPMIYQQGKEITIVGQLSEPMPGKVGQHEINFPVVDTRGHHLWQERPAHRHIEVYSTWDPFWFYHRPYFWPYHYRYRVYHGTHGYYYYNRYPLWDPYRYRDGHRYRDHYQYRDNRHDDRRLDHRHSTDVQVGQTTEPRVRSTRPVTNLPMAVTNNSDRDPTQFREYREVQRFEPAQVEPTRIEPTRLEPKPVRVERRSSPKDTSRRESSSSRSSTRSESRSSSRSSTRTSTPKVRSSNIRIK